MNRWTFNDPDKGEVVAIEQIFAEKPGGGVVASLTSDIPAATAVGVKSGNVYGIIKGYRLVKAVAAADTSINIAKGSGVAKGDVIAFGTKGVACTAVDTTADDYDKVTVTLGVVISSGEVLYQAKAASADAAEPIYTPAYITGGEVPADSGDFEVRLINGANLRKETANVGRDIVAMLKGIALV